jgi:hypothetical protein
MRRAAQQVFHDRRRASYIVDGAIDGRIGAK